MSSEGNDLPSCSLSRGLALRLGLVPSPECGGLWAEVEMTPAFPLISGSSPSCSWDLKTMINFYLVLFYTTLIMLSRQVRPRRRPLRP